MLQQTCMVAEPASYKGHTQTMLQRLSTYDLGVKICTTDSSHKLCCYSWFMSYDINQHNMLLTQARLTMLKYLCLCMAHAAVVRSK